jgi:aldehyde dehydrogenase (NAD+)
MTQQLFSLLRKKALSFRHETYRERLGRLQKIRTWIETHEGEIVDALSADFKKPRFETLISEISPVIDDIKQCQSKLKSWMKSRKVSTPSTLFGHTSLIRYENKGVVLIIAPWNYPFQLALSPLVAALAAGNTVVIKPSELTPRTAEVIRQLAEDCFSKDEVCVELGAKEKSQELLGYNFDHVFFTGSTQVGRIVAQACAQRLIPVTLELGGKSPTIIDQTADLDEAAEKIFWGKYLNRGQSCIAPDFILIHESAHNGLIQRLQKLIGENKNSDKGCIINSQHHQRLQNLARSPDDLNEKTLELIEVESLDHPAMKEEVFGPVLPILKYKTLEDLKYLLQTEEKPLAFYIFSHDRDLIDWLLNEFTSGGVGINSVLLHFANNNLPFGGVGASGIGRYHGHHGFLEMSHQRALIEQKFLSKTRRLVLPPYTPFKYKLLSWLK